MCRKNEVDCNFTINLLHYFYQEIQCDQSSQFCPRRSIWSRAWNIPILGVELKRHIESITNVRFPSNFLSMSPNLCFWWYCIDFSKLLDWKCQFIWCFKSITVIWNILQLFLFVDKMDRRVCLNMLCWCHFSIKCAK